MNQQAILHRPFDIETHKATFTNYLEVILLENGDIVYATPSHQEKLIQIACDTLQITRDELNTLCPPEFYFDFMRWLCQITHCVAVWNQYILGIPNPQQEETLHLLIKEQLFHGFIEEESTNGRI